MPEGPELYKAAQFLNKTSTQHTFSKVRLLQEPSQKRPAIPWNEAKFSLSAVSRGKEIRLTLSDDKKPSRILNILLTFGMAGRFAFTKTNQINKHSMLMFDTSDNHTFAFVDTRHFGRWYVTDEWSHATKRGPDIISEYEDFRKHVLSSLDTPVFNKPICEVLLDQRYFSSIGNYLRAEVLYRLNIDPFANARNVLEKLPVEPPDSKLDPDLLDMCHKLCWEVISLKGSGKPYDPDGIFGDWSVFEDWLQCYMKSGMGNSIDGMKRTIWHNQGFGKGKTRRHFVKKERSSEANETEHEQASPETKSEVSDPKSDDVKLEPISPNKTRTSLRNKRKMPENKENLNIPGHLPKVKRSVKPVSDKSEVTASIYFT